MEATKSSYGSCAWKSIHQGHDVIKREACWRIGNGQKVKIWQHSWLPIKHATRVHHLFWRGGRKPQLKYSSMKTHGHGMKMLLMVYLFLKKLPSLKKSCCQDTQQTTNYFGCGHKVGNTPANPHIDSWSMRLMKQGLRQHRLRIETSRTASGIREFQIR